MGIVAYVRKGFENTEVYGMSENGRGDMFSVR